MMEFEYNPPTEPYLDIIFEDEHIIVINKPSGILSVPGKEERLFDSILTRVQKKYPLAAASHRLDMSTSGILVIPKNRAAASGLGKQFQARTTQKYYYAWVFGKMDKQEGVIDLPLALNNDNKPLQKVDFENGRSAITYYQCLSIENDRSFVLLKPITGRSHQLRVHMKELGHPILGDKWYGSIQIKEMAPHLYLHAGKIRLKHPISNKELQFSVCPPFPVPSGIIL